MAFRPRKTFEQELRVSPEYKAAMTAKTVVVAEAIKAAAQPSRKTGYFIRRVRPSGTRIFFRDPFTHLIEWGSANNPAYAPIRRGIRAAGLRYEDGRSEAPGD